MNAANLNVNERQLRALAIRGAMHSAHWAVGTTIEGPDDDAVSVPVTRTTPLYLLRPGEAASVWGLADADDLGAAGWTLLGADHPEGSEHGQVLIRAQLSEQDDPSGLDLGMVPVVVWEVIRARVNYGLDVPCAAHGVVSLDLLDGCVYLDARQWPVPCGR